MESQLQRPHHGHNRYEDDPQNIGHEGEHDHHGEKKSVLKKVKDKAKKLKDTITKHGHGHGHEHEHRDEANYQEGYEEDDDDNAKEEMVNDPEVHGAPMYESSVIRITNLPREADDHLRKQTDTPGGRQDQNVRNEARSMGQSNVDESKAKIEPPMGLKEDPHFPESTPAQTPSNYQSKVTDPSGHGGKEAEVGPLVSQFDTLKAHDASNPKPESGQGSSADLNTPQAQDTITGKISSAASVITDKAVTAKNVVAAKMGYGGSFHEEPHDSSKKPALESATEYARIVSEKVAGAGTAVMAKVQGGGDNKGSSMAEYLSEKLKPGEEDKELSQVITDTLHKQKEAMWKTGEQEKQQPPLGKVTESEEVTARLGPPEEKKREGEDAFASGAESSGRGVAERLKDAVSSWLGKSTGIQTAQESIERAHVSDAGSGFDGTEQGEGVAKKEE